MNAIPQERRRQFLDELAKITGRALPPEEPIGAEAAFAEQDAKMFANGSAGRPGLADDRYRLITIGDQRCVLIGQNSFDSESLRRRRRPCSAIGRT
jgi:hypothetical protein